jgi:hypothetical protein
MKTLIYLLPVILVIGSCRKSAPNLPPYEPNKHITYTVLDNATHQPIDSVNVTFVYGNAFSDYALTHSNGFVDFIIPKDWVVNEVRFSKPGYCLYFDSPNSVIVASNSTIYMNRISYIRFNVVNQPPSAGTDRMVFSYPCPNLSSCPSFTYYGVVNTSTIVEAYTGNIGISTNIYSGSTYISSVQINTVTTSGDTIDVNVNY